MAEVIVVGFAAAKPGSIIIGHMAWPDVARGSAGADMRALRDLLDGRADIWTKASRSGRLDARGPPY
ncbi:amidohydrolase family protein [Sphingopyxis terrae]|uniref:hypothetical protein n=1 Tax=Sphingopyxis terrae TaxID=33052 RepID=UPI002A0E93D0|nr:hypothetical protein [Sphingopyxis terrae]MDX8356489.1 hypothetical protein [Sphingopyxis terrae]